MKAYSPIRNLEIRESRERRMPTILQEDTEGINPRIKSQIPPNNNRLEQQNITLKRRLNQSLGTEEDIHLLLTQNNRLKNEIENISVIKNQESRMNIYNSELHHQQVQQNLNEEVLLLSQENQKLRYELSSTRMDLDSAIRQNQISKENYQSELNFLKLENRDLKKRILTGQKQQISEIDKLKKKYTLLHLDDSESMKSTHAQQIRYLIDEMDKTKALLQDKTTELQIQFQQRKELKQRFDIDLGNKITQINQLKNQLLVIQADKDREIKNLTAKRELQKSRAAGLIGTSKQSTTYLDRQIKKLSDELKEKNAQLQNLNKQYLTQKKKNEDNTKTFNEKVTGLKKEHEELLRDKIYQFEKREAILKEDILEKKKKETELYLQIQKFDKELEICKHNCQILQDTCNDQETEIKGLKLINQQQREEHMKEIAKVMSEKLKRRSSRMLSSQRSLTGSLKDSNLVELEQSNLVGNLIDNLPTVKQEVYLRESNRESMAKSIEENNISENGDFENVVAHLKNTIQELKISQNAELEMVRLESRKISKKLQQKNEQYEDLLKRFAPLVKIRAGEKSLEQDRRQRIQRHWKADIALLQVLLEKHKIQVLL